MRIITIAMVTCFLALAFVQMPVANATICITNGELQEPSSRCCDSGTIPVIAGNDTFYVNTRNDATAGVVWIYQESNGAPSLQRGGVDVVGSQHKGFGSQPTRATTIDHVGPVGIGSGVPASGGDISLGGTDTNVGVSTLTPTIGFRVTGHIPSVKMDQFGIHTGDGMTPSPYAWADGRYDGCYDEMPSLLSPDTNLL